VLFDQRGQQVNTQYNAQQINFGAVQTTQDLIAELEKLKTSILKAKEDGKLDKKSANDAANQVTQAIDEAEEARPNKKSLLNYLTTGRSLIEGASAIAGLVPLITGAIEAVQKLF